jgi:hypothetical protein
VSTKFRINLCATIRFIAYAIRKGSIPILYSLATALGASFVCSVENVRCPVLASLIALQQFLYLSFHQQELYQDHDEN